VHEIIQNVSGIVAILLTGAFGKGEGSVKRTNNQVIPLNDYDILVITSRPYRSFHSNALENFAKSLGIHLDIDLFWMPLLRFVGKRLYWYDVKFGSKVIYGDEQIVDHIPIECDENPPPSEGLRLLFHRMAGLTEFFDPFWGTKNHNQRRSELLIYNSTKAILACCESLLILTGKWHPNCKKRCETLSKCFNSEFPYLASILPNLPNAVVDASQFHLYPSFKMYSDQFSLWFEAREYLMHVILHYWNRLCKTNIRNETEFLSDIIRKSHFVLTDYILYHLRYLFGKKKLCLNAIFVKKRFLDYLFVATFLLMSSINRKGAINAPLLRASLECIKKFFPFKRPPVEAPRELWCFTRDVIFEALKYIRR